MNIDEVCKELGEFTLLKFDEKNMLFTIQDLLKKKEPSFKVLTSLEKDSKLFVLISNTSLYFENRHLITLIKELQYKSQTLISKFSEKEVFLTFVSSLLEPKSVKKMFPHYFKDKETLKIALQKRPSYYEYISNELLEDEELFYIVASKCHVYYFSNNRFFDEEKVFLELFKRGVSYILIQASERIKNNLNFAKELSSFSGSYQHFSNKVKNDKELILMNLNNKINIVDYIPKECLKDRDILLECLKNRFFTNNYTLPSDVFSKWYEDDEIVREFMYNGYHNIYDFHPKYQDDKKLLVEFIQSPYFEMENFETFFQSLKHQNDKDIAKHLIIKRYNAMNYFNQKLKNDKDLFEISLEKNPENILFSEIEKDETLYQIVIDNNPKSKRILSLIPKDVQPKLKGLEKIIEDDMGNLYHADLNIFKDNLDLMFRLYQNYHEQVYIFYPDLVNNVDFVLKMVKEKHPKIIKNLIEYHSQILNNDEALLEIIENNPSNIRDLKIKSKSFFLKLFKRKRKYFKHLPYELFDDIDIYFAMHGIYRNLLSSIILELSDISFSFE